PQRGAAEKQTNELTVGVPNYETRPRRPRGASRARRPRRSKRALWPRTTLVTLRSLRPGRPLQAERDGVEPCLAPLARIAYLHGCRPRPTQHRRARRGRPRDAGHDCHPPPPHPQPPYCAGRPSCRPGPIGLTRSTTAASRAHACVHTGPRRARRWTASGRGGGAPWRTVTLRAAKDYANVTRCMKSNGRASPVRRVERAGSGRVTDLGGAHARARHTRNAVQGLRAVHPELDATRWQRARGPYGPERVAAYSRNTPDGDRFRSGDQGNQGVVLGGFPKSTFGTFFASAGASKYFCGRKPKAFA